MYCTAVPKCRLHINMLGVGTCCFKEHLISKFCKSKVGVRHTQSQPPASISSTSSPTLADPEWLATAGAAWFAWRMGGAIRRFLVGVGRSGFLVESSLKIDSSSEIRYISVKERHRTKESTFKIEIYIASPFRCLLSYSSGHWLTNAFTADSTAASTHPRWNYFCVYNVDIITCTQVPTTYKCLFTLFAYSPANSMLPTGSIKAFCFNE